LATSSSAFDLLRLNGRDPRQLPVLERKRMLLVHGGKHSRLMYAQHVKSRGYELFQLICEQNLEGIAAKHKNGLYSSSTKWIKIKNPSYTQAESRHEMFEKRQTGKALRAIQTICLRSTRMEPSHGHLL
jgi:ATP-dependent DNA ligase